MSDRVSPPSVTEVKSFKFEREIRDPIYDYVRITGIESKVIDTPEFQRLDRLLQTPIVRFVYPNATHTRKAHSLGVMHLYGKALLTLMYHQSQAFRTKVHFLYCGITEPPDNKHLDNLDQLLDSLYSKNWNFVEVLQIGRLAALLHDLGHGPFSHLFEVVCNELSEDDKGFKFDHEEMSSLILKEKFADRFKDTISLDDILKIIPTSGGHPKTFLQEIIDGPYDVDKLDYLNRDMYHCGTREYGTVDYERIIDGFRVSSEKLLISSGSIGALMTGFNALQLAYINVYFHKTGRIFDHMIIDALRLIPDYVKEIALDMNELLDTDDVAFIREIKHRSLAGGSDSDKFAKSWAIITDILNRKMSYKSIGTHSLTFAMVMNPNSKDEVSKLKKEFELQFADIGLKIDPTAQIKGLRISHERTLDWLTEPNIFDDKDQTQPVRSLLEKYPAYHSMLSQYQLLIHLFVNRSMFESQEKQGRIARAKQEIDTAIKKIRKTYGSVPMS